MFRRLSSRSALPFACAVAVVLSAGSAHVQGQQPPPPASTPADAPSDPQRFGAATTAVVVDVIVRDKAGRPVTDLKAADFQLLEDDQPQEIGNVTLVAPPATLGAAAGTAPAGAPTAASAIVPAATFVALVFDRLSPEGRALAWKGSQAYLESARDNDFAGVFVVSNRLETVQTYTTDRTALKKGARRGGVASHGELQQDGRQASPGGSRGDLSPSGYITAGAEEHGPALGATPTNPGGAPRAEPRPGTGGERRRMTPRECSER